MKLSDRSSFAYFELSADEETEAFKYTALQLAGIQNEIAIAAEEILSVSLDSDQLSLEAQKKLAYTKGRIECLKFLLTRADVVAETLAAKEAEQAQSHNQSQN